jgi:hypothetical protein
MSNPDSSVTSNLSAIATLGGLVVILVIFLFNYQETAYFNYLLYGGLPILVYLLASIMNLLAQQLSSKPIQAGKAFLGGLPSLVTTYLALLISYISYFRIPIASVFAPLFLDTSVNIIAKNKSVPITNSATQQLGGMISSLHQTIFQKQIIPKKSKKYTGGACCSPSLTLEDIEHNNPFIKGISYSFYIFFAICFGGVFGTRIALT